jgi:hypothetical protein
MKIRQSERGQALAEYMPLIPPILLLSVMMLVPLAGNTSDIICNMVNYLEPEKCGAIEMEEDEEMSEEEPEETCIELQESQGGSQCEQSSQCTVLLGRQNGIWSPSEPIETLVIKAGQGYHRFYPSGLNDGCYDVSIETDRLEWEKIGGGQYCKNISHLQAWEILICEEA